MRAHCLALIVGLLGTSSVSGQQLPADPAVTAPSPSSWTCVSGQAKPGTAEGIPISTQCLLPQNPQAAPGVPLERVDSIDRAPSLPMQETTADPYLIWGRSDFLLWWVKDGTAPPPLVSTGPVSASSGVLGQPGTAVVFGDRPLDYGTFSGGRWSVGAWFNLQQSVGLEVTGFVLEKRTALFAADSDAAGAPVIARPFVNAQTNTEFSAFATFPNRFAGGVVVASSDRLWGLDANLLHNEIFRTVFLRERPWADVRADLFAGFRYMDLRETLAIFQSSRVLAGGVASFLGNTVGPTNLEDLTDKFATQNFFCGGQFGSRWQLCRGPWLCDFLGKLALGETQQVIRVSGTTTLIGPAAAGGAQTATGGLLATSTNIGRSTRERFSAVPELGVQLGYQVCPEARVFVGYNLVYWTNVVRPGDQIDRVVNLTQVPIHPSFGPLAGPIRPDVPFRETDFWAQGVNFGFELRY